MPNLALRIPERFIFLGYARTTHQYLYDVYLVNVGTNYVKHQTHTQKTTNQLTRMKA